MSKSIAPRDAILAGLRLSTRFKALFFCYFSFLLRKKKSKFKNKKIITEKNL